MLDLLIKNGTIVDGSGDIPFHGDIGIIKDKIVKVEGVITDEAKRIIDAKGNIASPGFIDNHTHSDLSFLFQTSGYNYIEQGITTEISGQCGIALVPLTESSFNFVKGKVSEAMIEEVKKLCLDYKTFKAHLDSIILPTNMAFAVGHGAIREKVMGYDSNEPTEYQLQEMKKILREGLENGFIGMSSGLIYPPSVYAKKEELIELAKVVAEYDGVYISHIRGENDTVIEATNEAIDIGRQSGCRVNISHMKVYGRKNKGKSSETLGLIEAARKEGTSVTADQYPYLAGATSLLSKIPSDLLTEGPTKLINKLKEASYRQMVIDILDSPDYSKEYKENGNFDTWIVLYAPRTKSAIGKSIIEIAVELKKSPSETIVHLLMDNDGAVDMAYKFIQEHDMMQIIDKPYVMVGSDNLHYLKKYDENDLGGEHPRGTGTFPKFLRIMREKKVPIEKVIKRITSLPAEVANIKGIGLIKENYDANITIFDYEAITDMADYKYPHRRNKGIEYVIINGEIVLENGQAKGKKAGKWLKSIKKNYSS